MKKILCSMLLTLLIVFGAVNCLAAEEDLYMHYDTDFEDQRVGEYPKLFGYHHYDYGFYGERAQWTTAFDAAEIVKLEKDGNSDNLAAKIGADTLDDGNDAVARLMFHYYPYQKKGVISFYFRIEDFKVDKTIQMNGNMNNRTANYADNKNYWTFMNITGEKLYYQGNKLITDSLKKNTWYRVDFKFDIESNNARFYLDGKATSVSLPPNVNNITEMQINFPKLYDGGNSPIYFDDIRAYEADDIIDDATLDEHWKGYEESMFYPGYEFESVRSMFYNYMAYRTAEGKKYTVVGTDKLFDGSKKLDLPAKSYEKDGEVMVPLRAIAESYGAKVGWQELGNKVTLEYGGKTMSFAPGESIYYLDGVPSTLTKPAELVDGATCMNLDILFRFLGQSYHKEQDILWFDEPRTFDWHMPVNPDSATGASYNWSSNNSVYETLLRTFLFERPSQEELDTAFRNTTPEYQHPRIGFTPETLAAFKEQIKEEPQLQTIIDSLLVKAEQTVGKDLVKYQTRDGKRFGSIGTVGDYCEVLAPAYVFSEDPEQKARFKADIWRHFQHIGNKEIFPDWMMQSNSALGNGDGSYGLALAFDWIDWTDEEREFIIDMCRRNIFDDTIHSMTCPLYYANHANNYGNGNQNLITPGGFSVLATAMYEYDPEYFNDIIRGCLRGSEGGWRVYFPAGEYPEGISYWRYAGSRFPIVLKSYLTAYGTDWGRLDIPGVAETATFPFRMRGAITAYAFGDGQSEEAIIPLQLFVADQTGNKALAQYYKDFTGKSADWSALVNWTPDTSQYKQGLDVYDKDVMNVSNSTLILKTGWTTADTAVALHGGTTSDPHGHTGDPGTVQFDMSGVRFGLDLPRETYNLRDLGHYDKARVNEFWPNGYPLNGAYYYRIKAEGHNTIVANRQHTNIQDPTVTRAIDVKANGTTEFIKTEFSDISSFGLLNMTNMNDIFQSGLRGVKLDKINNVIEIQDDFTAKQPTDFMWSMHTYASIEIAEDGKSAILTQNNQKIKATIINDCDYVFENLPAQFDESYGTKVKPPFETPNYVYGKDDPFYITHGQASDVKSEIRKLVVRTPVGKDAKHFKLAVTFQPYVEGNTPVQEFVSMEQWKSTKMKRQTLASVMVDGKPLDIFEPDKLNYPIRVVDEKSPVPEITAVPTNSAVKVEIIKATTVPGTTVAKLMLNGVVTGMYSFVVAPINNTANFHSEYQLPIIDFSVSSEPQGENPASNLFDGSFTSKFATDEQGGNVIMDLGEVIEGDLRLNIACLSGDKRTENFKIEYSLDGLNWTEAFNGHNSGTTVELEQFKICNKARYVKVSFYGSSQGSWVSVTEMFVSNEGKE